VAHYFTLHFNNIHWMLPPLLFRVMRLFSWSGCCCAASSTERDEAIPSRPRFVSPHFRVKDKFVPRVRHMIYHRKPPWHVVKHMSPCSIRMGGGKLPAHQTVVAYLDWCASWHLKASAGTLRTSKARGEQVLWIYSLRTTARTAPLFYNTCNRDHLLQVYLHPLTFCGSPCRWPSLSFSELHARTHARTHSRKHTNTLSLSRTHTHGCTNTHKF
jgi:hypothetical protein